MTDPKDVHQATLVVGSDPWPFPVPLVEKKGKWAFATKTGLREVLRGGSARTSWTRSRSVAGTWRRRGRSAEEDRDGNGVLEYAQKIISSPGKRDGLAWRNPDGSLGGPVAENIAAAIEEGYSSKALPYHGYSRILATQGPSARLGAMSYVIDGKMIGGFRAGGVAGGVRLLGESTRSS